MNLHRMELEKKEGAGEPLVGQRRDLRHCPILEHYCTGQGSSVPSDAALTLEAALPTLQLIDEAWGLSAQDSMVVLEWWPNIIAAVVLNAQTLRLESSLKPVLVKAAAALLDQGREEPMPDMGSRCNTGDLAEVVGRALQHIPLEDTRGSGLFKKHCKLNHACSNAANVRVVPRPDRIGIMVVALKEISVGEELEFDYLGESHSGERAKALHDKYGFECKCGACTPC